MQYQKHPRYRATEPKSPVTDDDFDYEADTPMCAVPMPVRLYNALKRATQQSGDITLREFADTYSGYFLRMSNQGLGQSTLNMFNEILDRVDLKLTTKRTTVIPSAHIPDPRLLNEQIAKPPISGSNHD